MRFNVIWLADDGYAEYAEHFEYPSRPEAIRFISRKINRKETIDSGVSGYLVIYADSAFIRRHTLAPGSAKKRTTDRCEIALACAEFPHLIRP